ncbi:MAG: patatin-like phospholipase family protein [Cyanobacteria bacterium NC_groundwater_1444_Ag_S-0.65um_54_12]|nr:patatin-like phospholipase family protein [Cyanobacteria bacterium NC_groundwater_1444_Ag_S-0.65um_54_12]
MGKVGLVLSGGVAKGAYEAGLLKALAQKEIIPTVIVGISAGAINGTFAASAIARGMFNAEFIEEELVWLWQHKANAANLYACFDQTPQSRIANRSLSNIFTRLGIDPLHRHYAPRIGWDTILAFEQLVKGDFVSLISHGFLRTVLEARLFPVTKVIRPVTLSIVATDLQGSTVITAEQELLARYAHFEDFVWLDRTENEWESFIMRLRQMIVASASFPFIFPPCPLDLADGSTHLFADGGIMDCAPISRAIQLDPDIDTVLVSLGPTIIDAAAELAPTLPKLLSRVFTMLAGRYLIANFRKVAQVNRRIERLMPHLDRDKKGRISLSRRNEDLCMAAGFTSLEQFLSRRVVKLVPICPIPALPGEVFDGFFKPELMLHYIQQGYTDTLSALRHAEILPAPAQIETIIERKRRTTKRRAAEA